MPDQLILPKPWRDGAYRCPYQCHDPSSPYPQRKWRSEKGILKHMAECDCKPPELPPSIPDSGIRERWGTCDCGWPIWMYDSVWMQGDHDVVMCEGCWDRMPKPCHLDCVGLRLPDLSLIA